MARKTRLLSDARQKNRQRRAARREAQMQLPTAVAPGDSDADERRKLAELTDANFLRRRSTTGLQP